MDRDDVGVIQVGDRDGFLLEPLAVLLLDLLDRYDAAKARQLLAEAGYSKGFDAGDFWCDAGGTNYCEPVLNYLQAAGIRSRLRPLRTEPNSDALSLNWRRRGVKSRGIPSPVRDVVSPLPSG